MAIPLLLAVLVLSVGNRVKRSSSEGHTEKDPGYFGDVRPCKIRECAVGDVLVESEQLEGDTGKHDVLRAARLSQPIDLIRIGCNGPCAGFLRVQGLYGKVVHGSRFHGEPSFCLFTKI